jgi:ribose transport system ATP-binding protein
VFDEPTRGIDVNAKAEIHSLIREFVKEKNRAAIVISSDVNELVTVSDRIVTMSKGQITKIIDEDIEQKNVLKYITTKGR